MDIEHECPDCGTLHYAPTLVACDCQAPRYRYEFYRATDIGETQRETWWLQRAQWLVFDRNGVGCMASLGTEAEAALIVNALNAYTPEVA